MKVKWKQSDPALKSIKDVVIKNTGKTEEELLNDTKKYKIKDLDKIIEKLEEAQKKGIFVTVVGDYDTDGVAASTDVELLLSSKGIKHRIRLPKRHTEGYGLNEKIID